MKLSKKGGGKESPGFPLNIIPVMALLSNLTIKTEGEEVEARLLKKRLVLEYVGSPVKIEPEVRLDTGSQINCIGELVFKQLELPMSILTGPKGTIKGREDTTLKDLGRLE